MDKLLNTVGIERFENAIYIFKSKNIDILGDGDKLNVAPRIEIWELEGGYRHILVSLKVDGNWSTAIMLKYKGQNLFDSTRIACYIGDGLVHQFELSYMDGFEDDDSYFFTSDYAISYKVFSKIIEMLNGIELETKEVKDISYVVYAPYKAFNSLRENIEENVKDRTDIEEVKEVAQIFMEYHGEDFRSVLFSDSRLIFRDDESLELADLIEDIMYEYFGDDDVLLEED